MMRQKQRAGFTILEVLLSSVIGIMLMGALYAALGMVITRTEIQREQVAINDLTRAVVNRIQVDLSSSLTVLPPKSGGNPDASVEPNNSSSASNSSSSTTASSTSSSSASTSSTTSAGASAGSGSMSGSASGTTSTESSTTGSSSTSDSSMSTEPVEDIPLQAGVVGTDTQLTIFSSRVPTALTDGAQQVSSDMQLPSDLRRITYYLGSVGGLCRQERPWVTAEGVWNSVDPDFSTELEDNIAPEVVDMTFEYFDGGAWLSEWDGSSPGLDGVTPMGPPRAIRITLTMEVPSRRSGALVQKRIQHTIPVHAAVGTYLPPMDENTTTPAATGSTTGGM